MDKHNPIEFLIDFAWANGADRSVVNSAKEELKKLRSKTEIAPVAWARINNFGDLYDLRLSHNPYSDAKLIVPLYRMDSNGQSSQ